ncbi:MAG: aspartyl protease family protein [Sedimentisphaerales bacterium]|nr:aspartyl protease family protein [Sedimentisphaerales bacterium]
MPIVEHPFIAVDYGGPVRPFLPIRITNPDSGKDIITWGLIDTGADECAIPAKFASVLGHDLDGGTEKQIRTSGGLKVAYAHTSRIEIFEVKNQEISDTVAYTINNTPIDFMPDLRFCLLGARSFLSNFILTIDYPRQVFSIRRPK